MLDMIRTSKNFTRFIKNLHYYFSGEKYIHKRNIVIKFRNTVKSNTVDE